jgi:hypothetical protein
LHKFAIAALVFGLASAHAQAPGPSCDSFMTRLQDAGKVLMFPLPPVKFERTPVDDYDKFWVSYDYGDDAEFEGELSCKDGKVVDYQMDYPFDSTFNGILRRQHIAAAAVYALTGGQPQDVLKIVNDAMTKRPKIDNADWPEVRLSNEFGVGFGFSTMIIDGWNE